MKKKLLLTLCVLSTLSLAACGKTVPTTPSVDTQTAKSSDIYESKIVKLEQEEGLEADGVITDNISSKYEFTKTDDKNGTFKESTIYDNDNLEYNTVFTGTYEIKDGVLTFNCTGSGDDIVLITATIDEKTNELSDVKINYTSKELMDVSGTYTGSDENYGDITLEVALNGNVNVTTSNGVYDGYLYKDEAGWMLSFSNEEVYENWIVEFNEDKFTHTNPVPEDERTFVESREITGPLGQLTLAVYSDSFAETTIKLDGTEFKATGYVYDYESEDTPGTSYGISLTSEDSVYNVYLEVENGVYTGYFAKNF